jgi:hypothetical protein
MTKANDNIRYIFTRVLKQEKVFLKRSMGLEQSRHVVHVQRTTANGRRNERIAETLATS